MKTIIRKYKPGDEGRALMEEAGAILRSGGLVAFPTETVYGLGGDALNPQASGKIYAAKGRPSDNPLIVHIAKMDSLESLCPRVPDGARRLAELFWPGPLTMVLEKSEIVPSRTTGGLGTVAVRMPSHPVASELIRSSGVMIAAPSANLSGRPSPTTASHVIQDMDGRIDMIIDGGPSEIGLESTIVDMSTETPILLRPGYVDLEMLRACLGQVEEDPALLKLPTDDSSSPKAPGMKYRHYAPGGVLSIVEGESRADRINELTDRAEKEGKRVAVLCLEENISLYECPLKVTVGRGSDEESIAANLYRALRRLDDMGVELIFSESFAGEGLRAAVMNRLIRAAGGRIIR